MKKDDIKAWKEFCKAINEQEDGSYFSDLVKHEDVVERNITGDLVWNFDAYAPVRELDVLREKVAQLIDEKMELKQHDIREIKRNIQMETEAVRDHQKALDDHRRKLENLQSLMRI